VANKVARLVALLGALAFTLSPAVAEADPVESAYQATRWSVMVGGGYFVPAVDGWKEQYGQRGGWLPVLAGAFSLTPRLAIGAEAGYFSAETFARNVLGAVSVERQRLMLIPVTLGAEYAFRFPLDQVAVPFIGVGYRRVAYRLEVEGKDRVRGGANGVVARGGVDILLNALDPSASSGLADEWGVARSYLRLEAQWASVNAPSTGGDIDLGGQTVLAGLRFEF
jgi:outer membrane protein W